MGNWNWGVLRTEGCWILAVYRRLGSPGDWGLEWEVGLYRSDPVLPDYRVFVVCDHDRAQPFDVPPLRLSRSPLCLSKSQSRPVTLPQTVLPFSHRSDLRVLLVLHTG